MLFLKMLVKRILLLLFMYQLCRILFLLFNFGFFKSLTVSGFLTIIYGSFRFDLSTLMYLNTLYIAMFIIPFNIRFNPVYQKIAKYIFIITNAAGLAVNLADIAYYPFIIRRTNASFFLEFKNDTNLLLDSGKFIYSYWYIALLIVFFTWVLIKTYNVLQPKKEAFSTKALILNISLLPLLVIMWLGFARGSFVPSNRPINTSYAGDYVSNPNEINLVINTPFSIMTTWGNIKVPEVNYYPGLEDASVYYSPVQSYPHTGPVNKKNVVIVVVESLSRELLSSLNDNIPGYRGYTPFLDSLIKHSLTFKYGFANGRRSIEALPSVFASIPSPTEAYVLTPYSGNTINSIGTVLKKYGYHTSFFHGAVEGSMGFSSFMKMAGVDHFFSKKDYNNNDDYDGTWGIYDGNFLQYWAKQLNTFPQPFCSAIFTLSTHHPYKLPEKYAHSFDKGTMEMHPSVQYLDLSLKEFFETASKMPWYKNTVFVITADHAATFSFYKEYNNPRGVFAVPVIFYTPDSSLTGFRNDLAQQADIFPSIIDYLGINDTILSFGKSILKSDPNHFVVNTYSGTYQIFEGDLMLQFDGKKVLSVFRYREDLMLENNIMGKYPDQEKHLLAELKAYIQQYDTRVRQNKMCPESRNDKTPGASN